MSMQESFESHLSITSKENHSVSADEFCCAKESGDETTAPEDRNVECSVETDELPFKGGHETKERRDIFSETFDAFKKAFEERPDAETRLQLAVEFMEAALAQGGTPHFRSFWEARRLCLPLFRENISPVVRAQFWSRYSELSKEARRLKEILDEQSAFAAEQIEIAIRALEEQIARFDEQVANVSEQTEFLVFPQTLKEQYGIYQSLQKQLGILNAHAARINALRKELLKTDMRVRHKNKFFQRLSAIGDQVFPKRKDLIKQLSSQFIDDVERFIQTEGGAKKSYESFYFLREEIKALQNLAKVLTLNTHAFTQTRTRLSECWDEMKGEEKERKKERAQQRLVFRQNQSEIEERIKYLRESVEKREVSPGEAHKEVEHIVSHMRQVVLGRDEVKALRDQIGGIRALLHDQVRLEEEARQKQEEERNFQKKEKYRLLKEQAQILAQQHESQDADQLSLDRDTLLDQVQHSSLTKNEKQEIERLLKPLRDVITEKKEQAMMALSEDDRQALQQLQHIASQRRQRRQEIKVQLEALRKTAGSSSLDFEKAMSCTAQISEEKERLEKATQAIKEIEGKIAALQTKMRK